MDKARRPVTSGGRAWTRSHRLMVVQLGMIAVLLALAPGALAVATPFTWEGRSTVSEEWSFPANWEGGSAPSASTAISTLTFPRLTSTACTAERATHPCYFSWNDLSGLSAESIQLDDGNTYLLGGEQLALSGGLTAGPAAGSSGPAGDLIELPLDLTASQKWSIDAHGVSGGENGLSIASNITGSASALHVEVADRAALLLENDTEVGPLTLEGANPGIPGLRNGVVALRPARINAGNEHAVELSHIFLFGSGELGALTTSSAELGVGTSIGPAGKMTASSVSLDPASEVTFHITGNGMTPGQDFSQLVAGGAVALAGADIAVTVTPEKEKPCPTLTAGETFTFISTKGPLTGTFANAAEHGAELPLFFGEACGPRSQKMRISYHESGGVQTVTGTVEAFVKEEQEAREQREGKERQEAIEAQEAKRHQEAIEVQEAKRRQEAIEAQEARRRQEAAEHAAASGAGAPAGPGSGTGAGGVLSITEASPSATIAGRTFTVSRAGALSLKVKCPAGAGRCAGTVTLRTLRAVSAGKRGTVAGRRILTLATASFDITGGQERSVVLRLSAAARKLLARSHVLPARVTILAHNGAGASHTALVTVSIRAARGLHG